ncbi:hypothetical protein [Phreatobacter cathodiphilus]|uniref:von Hippel-Lindau disease tumour suppressor beta domain-containing protein n=1 Tax=Phreatobacter cathodiphilus TaxID=1868589 RepID=A0A2S0N8U5_9HYPH|nr:hypothetical protein [Phreatobacter cathodiphilus]AVO44437.1 hypothetical protein C6569_04815 [Phreatobacter cathodiphilus]
MKAYTVVLAFCAALIVSNVPSSTQAQQRQPEPPIAGPGCPRAGTKSPRSSQRVPVTFFNGQHREAHLYWVDFNGNSVFYAKINRGQQYQVNSFAGHVWVALNERGRCVSTFAVSPAGGTIGL